MSEFKLRRCEAIFNPAGSDKVEHFSLDPESIKVTETVTIGDRTFSQSHRPFDAESMRLATNGLAKFTMDSLRTDVSKF